MSASFDPSARLRAAVHPVTLLVVAALIVLPWAEPDKFTLHILSLIAIASIAAMGLQVLLGYSGQLSIGQAAFYGIGAYTSALLTARLGVPFPLALIGAGAAAAIASLLMVPITRLTGAYLAVATLGFSIIVFLFIQNEEWLTGGSYGFIGIPRAELFGYALRDPMWSYYLNVGVADLFIACAPGARSQRPPARSHLGCPPGESGSPSRSLRFDLAKPGKTLAGDRPELNPAPH